MVNVADGLRVRSLDSAKWQLLPGTDSAVDPFWSQDSTTIGFFSEGRLHAIALDGSSPQSLAPAPEPRGGSWRGGVSDGQILFAAAGKLQTLDLRSGKVEPLPLRFAEGQPPALPIFCPEGDGFLYLMPAGRESALFRSSLSSREATGERVLPTFYGAVIARHPRSGRWHLFFMRGSPGQLNRTLMTAPMNPKTGALAGDSVRVIEALSNWVGTDYASFDVSAGGIILWRNTFPALPIWRLRWFDRNGNITRTIGDAAGYASIALAPDEAHVATVQGYPDQQVWIYNLQNGTGTRLPGPPATDSIIWSPDGQSVYYSSRSDTGLRVMRQAVAPGSMPETLYKDTSSRSLMAQAITPDSRYLILSQYIDVSSTTTMQVDLSAPFNTRQPEPLFANSVRLGQTNVRLSPNGKILIATADGTIYACPFPPAGHVPRQVTAFPTQAWAFFSRDSRTLYVVSGQALYSHPVITTADGSIRVGDRSLLFRLVHAMRAYATPAAASRDGRILAIATDSVEETRMQVLTDWTTLLKP